MFRTVPFNLSMLVAALLLAASANTLAVAQAPAFDPFAPTPPKPATPAAPKPADDDPFAPMPTTPPQPTTPMPKPPAPAPMPTEEDPFSPMPKPPVVPRPPVIPTPPPAVMPVPTQPGAPGVAPTPPPRAIPVPVMPAPVNPDADGDNYGFPPGTTVIIIAAPGRYQYPWGNTKGNWVPFYYNKQWHLYRSWCQ